MKRILLSSIVIAGFFAACKKDESAPSLQQLILGKWNVVLDSTHEVHDGQAHDQSYNVSSDTIEFRNDGQVYYYGTNGKDTNTYRFIDNQRLVFGEAPNADTAIINTLTSSSFIYYFKGASGSSYWEDWTGLRK